MKYVVLILTSIVLYACKEGERDSSSNNTETKRPELIYISNLSKDLITKNNTLFLNHQKFSGVLYSLYENTTDTISLENYANGILEGVSKKWFPNAQLMEIRHYTKGQKNGRQTAYWANGKKRFEFSATEDVYEGELKEWNADGTLIHLATYNHGQEEGPQKMWYDNGKIRANYVIIKGKRYGLLGTKNCKNVSDSIFIIK